ncbi:MAG TPA: GvpL/GvpF family gas vesicle protein [Streptosporangiaceae bacterium]|nr:GvpL/GvpF family gas vesicle protein [Streptosporangiaceae bacterium]
MTECGVWAYAVSAEIGPDRLAGLTGVAGQPVRSVTGDGLAAAVSTVSMAEFGEQPLRRRLEDLAWLGATARAHHQVIEALAPPVVPLRLATIYRDDSNVAALLTQRQADFAAALAELTGRSEWGVKLFVGQSVAPATPAEPDLPGAGPGLSYLRRRQRQLAARDQARQAGAATAQQVHAALGRLAAASQLRPLQSAELTGEVTAMLLNATYLVDDAASARFAEAAATLGRQHGVRVEITGPWPPYSFAVLAPREAAS